MPGSSPFFADTLPLRTDAPGDAVRHDLAAFFRGFGFTTEDRLDRLVVAMLDDPALVPGDADAAVALAEHRAAEWFATVLGDGLHERPARTATVLAAGRAAFLAIDGARHWPETFLADPPAPAELAEALREAIPMAVPQDLPAVMPDQDLGLPSIGAFRRRALRWLARRALAASM